ncbi:hypothetical protein F5X97DRAFT_329581 [Nemania serpens]|nr:hypothetical protein F5X97DRAFT_329581 [Nemania serpens]
MNKWFRHLNPLKESEGVQEILSTHLGAEKVIVFDHAYREEEAKSEEENYTFDHRPKQSIVVRNPHSDQTTRAAYQRLSTHFTKNEQDEYLNGSWRIRIVKQLLEADSQASAKCAAADMRPILN